MAQVGRDGCADRLLVAVRVAGIEHIDSGLDDVEVEKLKPWAWL